ncbi:MAG: MBL fold metallo-hydrolase, partial [candidate division NC10 bacterium]
VDNATDMLAPDQGPARRADVAAAGAPRIPAAFLEGGQALDALRAEHGFSALVTIETAGKSRRLLFDAGLTPDGLVENMRRLSLSPKDIEVIVLSHGHFDHTTGLDGLARSLGRANLPVIIHPEFWSRRRILIPGREPIELPSTSKPALIGAGFEIVEERQPSFLLDGSLLVTGEVDRTTEFERGMLVQQAWRDGEWQPDPLILDDQALIAHVRGKGLVVLTGCGHAGVINILIQAQALTGGERIHAVLGGFHLTGGLFDPLIPRTVQELQRFAPSVVVPGHCTGWKATHAIAAALPSAFVQNSVGTTFIF